MTFDISSPVTMLFGEVVNRNENTGLMIIGYSFKI
jgi:hypothetical protein